VIFNVKDAAYMRWLSMGLICWQFISSALAGAEGIFTSARGVYTECRIPYSFFCIKYVILQILVFLHQLPVVLYCVYAFGISIRFAHVFSFLLGLAAVSLVLFCLSFILSVLCLRFYDIPQIVNLLLYIAFMFTPIFWMPQMAASRAQVIDYNPFYYLLDVMRSPLMGQDTAFSSWAVVSAALAAAALGAFGLFARCRRRLAFY
jgi:ABC-type polysaccharide/polyol phosphate export permease